MEIAKLGILVRDAFLGPECNERSDDDKESDEEPVEGGEVHLLIPKLSDL